MIKYKCKKCSWCGEVKSINNFYKSKTQNHRFGVENMCKSCSNQYHERYYKENKDKILKQQKTHVQIPHIKIKIREYNKQYQKKHQKERELKKSDIMEEIVRERINKTTEKYRKLSDEELQDHINNQFTENIGNVKRFVKPKQKIKPEIKPKVYEEMEKKGPHCAWCNNSFPKIELSKTGIGSLCMPCLKNYRKLHYQ